jgi:hypothetical protein
MVLRTHGPAALGGPGVPAHRDGETHKEVVMTTHSVQSVRSTRASRGARMFGYLLSGGIQVVLIWLVNVAPGWRAVPFLTEEASHVIWLFNLSLVIALAVNVVWVVYDPPRVRRLGDAVNAAISLAVMARLLEIFPFDFASAGWETAARVLLILSIVGTGIAVVVNLVQALRPAGPDAGS